MWVNTHSHTFIHMHKQSFGNKRKKEKKTPKHPLLGECKFQYMHILE